MDEIPDDDATAGEPAPTEEGDQGKHKEPEYRPLTEEEQKIIDDHGLWRETKGDEGKQANFSGWDLRIVDLEGVDLSWANLQKTQLDEANLLEADLSWVNLQGARLLGTNLRKTDFYKANLKGACLIGANL